jgi:ubiquinone/menaquinone biosynthesis C-methylase UbiE
MKNYLVSASHIILLLITSYSLNAQNEFTEEFEKRYLQRQPPEKIMELAGIKPGMTIGEIGAGRGRMTVYMAREVGPAGRIYANDIDELSLSYLKGRCRKLGFNNVEIVTGGTDDPLLPGKSLDMAIMVLVFHMIENPDKLLENLKKSLKPGASLVIIDPVDKLIDSEFGIDRSKPGAIPPIAERVKKSATAAGYDIVKTDSSLPQDLIFFLKPVNSKAEAGSAMVSLIQKRGIKAAWTDYAKMKGDTLNYDLSEITFQIAAYEFIGSKSFEEAVAILQMGIELYPKSSLLYAEMGEAYLFQGDKNKSRECWQKALSLDPENPNGKFLLENFDAIFDQMHPKK